MKHAHVKLTMLVILAILAGLLAACVAAPPPQEAAPATEEEAPATAEEAAPAAEAAAVERIAMILPGRADDLAWNTAAYQGLENIKNDLGVQYHRQL